MSMNTYISNLLNIEETNNLIKCLKWITFGYRKYDHFITRVFLIKDIIKEWLKITL